MLAKNAINVYRTTCFAFGMETSNVWQNGENVK